MAVSIRARLTGARFMRFAGVGLVATATDFAVFNLLLFATHDPPRLRVLLANTTAFAVATAVGYVLNARFTFRAARSRQSLVRYVAVALSGAAVYDLTLLALLTGADAHSTLAINLVKLGAVTVSAAWNFCGFALLVFARPAVTDRQGARA